MADVWVLLTIAAFFALCIAFISGCDRIIGPDEQSDLATTPGDEMDADETAVTTAGIR